MAKRKVGNSLHRHGCTQCYDRYDDACSDMKQNSLCVNCKTGRPVGWALLILNRYPRDCCYEHSRPPTKDEIRRYDLAGDAPWFICNTCKLTHPFFSPTKNPERYAAAYATSKTEDS